MTVASFTNPSEPSDERLVRDVVAGRRDVFAHLVRRYERLAHAAAWAVLRDHQLAEDVVQDSFVKAYTKLNTLRTPRTFGAWLLTIVRRTATDRARRRHYLVPVATLPETPSLISNPDDDAKMILDAVTLLSESDQQLVLLRYCDGLAVADIAVRLDCAVGTVTKALSRALARLRNQFKELL